MFCETADTQDGWNWSKTRSLTTLQADQELYNEIASSDAIDQFTDPKTLVRLLRLSIGNQMDTAAKMDKIHLKITEETKYLSKKVEKLDDKNKEMDQYSRKGVAILTGLQSEEDETQVKLVDTVLGKLNSFYSPNPPLNYKDFIAIHRNGKEGRNGRPPTITLKFLRYYEKEYFFRGDIKRKFKAEGLNLFHSLCNGLMNEQKMIKEYKDTKFVYYAGHGRQFTVCTKENEFYNNVSNYNDFLAKIKSNDNDF